MSYAQPTPREARLIELLTTPHGVEGFWEVVDILMKYFYDDPILRADMLACEEDAKKARDDAFNKWASNKDKSFRLKGKMPQGIYMALRKAYNNHLPMDDEKFANTFFTKYPKFRVTDKI